MLPKPHLSYSQWTVWKTNKDRFRREYFESGEKLDTEALRFGKSFALSIEDGTYKDILPDLQVYPEVEFKIQLEVEGVPILSYIDSYHPELNVFHEYKTGKVPWTQVKVQKHDQLVFYAMALRQLTGHMPEYCDLHWIETRPNSKKTEPQEGFSDTPEHALELTGRIEVFRRYFDIREVERMEKEIRQAAEEISEAYQKYIDEF